MPPPAVKERPLYWATSAVAALVAIALLVPAAVSPEVAHLGENAVQSGQGSHGATSRPMPLRAINSTVLTHASTPVCDSFINESDPKTVYGGSGRLLVKSASGFPAGSDWHALLKFDYSEIPPDSTIVSAGLFLYATSRSSHPEINTIEAHAIIDNWDCGSVNWENRPGFNGGPTGYLAYNAPSPWMSVNVTVDVAGIVSGRLSQFGWALMFSTSHSAAEPYAFFASSENGQDGLRPILIINYTVTPSLKIIEPSQGSHINGGSWAYIMWAQSGFYGEINATVYMSTDGGANFWVMETWALGPGVNESWQYFENPSGDMASCYLAVGLSSGDIAASDTVGPFTLTHESFLAHVLSPRIGENLTSGGSKWVTWQYAGGPGSVSSELSLSTAGNAGPFEVFAAGIGGLYYNWTLPKMATSTECVVRIEISDGLSGSYLGTCFSDNFTIYSLLPPNATAEIVSLVPAAGANLTAQGSAQVSAALRNFTGQATVFANFTSDGGQTWSQVGTQALDGNAGWDVSIPWTVPDIQTSHDCRVSVEAVSAGIRAKAQSGNFTVWRGNGSAPLITVLGPLRGSNHSAGSPVDVRWKASGGTLPLSVSLEFMNNRSASSWQTIALGLPNTGLYSWAGYGENSSEYRIRAWALDGLAPPRSSWAASGNFTIWQRQIPADLLERVTLTPQGMALEIGGSEAFTAQGYLHDGRQAAGASYAWALAPAGIAVLNSSAGPAVRLTGTSAGNCTLTVTVTYNGTYSSNSSSVRISPVPLALDRVDVAAESTAVVIGESVRLSASGFNSTYGITMDSCSWYVDPSWAGTFSQEYGFNTTFTAGLFTGSAKIRASCTKGADTIEGCINITVSAVSSTRTIIGAVRDMETRNPVPQANVTVTFVGNGTVASQVITLANGSFIANLPLAGDYRVNISCGGYVAFSIQVRPEGNITDMGTIYLSPSSPPQAASPGEEGFWLWILLAAVVVALMVGSVASFFFVLKRKERERNRMLAEWSQAMSVMKKRRCEKCNSFIPLGVSMCPTCMAAARPPPRKDPAIDEIYLLYRDGRLIKHHTRRLKPGVDQKIFSSMLVAVQDFVKDSYGYDAGALDELKFGDYRILMGRGRFIIVAAIVSGDYTERLKGQIRKVVSEVESIYGEVLSEWDGNLDAVAGVNKYLEYVMMSAPAVQ